MAEKYRPSFSAEQILFLINASDSYHTSDSEAESLKQTTLLALRTFALKINSGIKIPQYITKEKESLEVQLGFAPAMYDGLTPEQKRKMAWERYMASPAHCSKDEIEMAMTHGYENNLLTKPQYILFCKENMLMSDSEAESEWSRSNESEAI